MMNLTSCTTSLAGMPANEPSESDPPMALRWRLIPLLPIALLISACAGLPQVSTAPEVSTPVASSNQSMPVSLADDAMIADIVGFSRQIFSPISTTLQFSQDDDDPLLQHFISLFSDEGYGIQRVTADQGSNFFSYSKNEISNDSGNAVISFNTSIGAVNIGRDYTLPNAKVVSPASPVKLSGTRVPVSVADQPSENFQLSNDPANATVVYSASLNLAEQAPPVISLLTDDLIDRVVNSQTQTTSAQALNSTRLEVNNLFFAEQSNFTNVLDDYERIDRQIIVFGNDSMILGSTNKLLIEQLVKERLQPNDLVGLVGCSNGPTVLDIGNEGLALGRAGRVTQALLSQGVARERILDEGCWAPVSAGDKFPARGVVVEIWRKLS